METIERMIVDEVYTPRITFMLRDVVELRENNWTPRSASNNWLPLHEKNFNPTSIQKIREEATNNQSFADFDTPGKRMQR